jgi:hypothetical protein
MDRPPAFIVYRVPHWIARSISPMIGVSCLPMLRQLRHRGDVDQGLGSTPILLMTQFAMIEGADAAGGCR